MEMEARSSSTSMSSTLRWQSLKRPRGYLRIIEFVTSLVIFASVSSLSGYSKYAEFSVLVLIGVLDWLFSIFMLTSNVAPHVLRPWMFNWMGIIEFLGDCVAVVLTFLITVIAANKCGDEQEWGSALCDGAGFKKIKVGMAAAFLTAFAFLLNAALSYHDARRQNSSGSHNVDVQAVDPFAGQQHLRLEEESEETFGDPYGEVTTASATGSSQRADNNAL